MVVGKGHILDQNLAHHADPRLSQTFVNGEIVKGFHNLGAQLLIFPVGFLAGQLRNASIPPLVVQGVGRTGLQLVGTHPVQAAH